MFKQLLYVFSSIFLLTSCDNIENNEFISYPPLGLCNIDTPQNDARVDSTENIQISGWGFHKTSDDLPDQITLYLLNQDGSPPHTLFLSRGLKREDVATAFKRPKLVDSGLYGTIMANTIPPGRYELLILQSGRRTEVIRCNSDTKHYINVF